MRPSGTQPIWFRFGRVLTVVAVSLLNAPRWDLLSPAQIELTDPSWRVALHQIAVENLQWGPEVVNTLGPLGFIGYPIPAYSSTFLAALIAMTGAHLLAVALTFSGLSRLGSTFPAGWVWVTGGAWVFTRLVWNPLFEQAKFPEALAACFALGCFLALTSQSVRANNGLFSTVIQPNRVLGAVAVGVATSALVLIKLSTGLQAIAVGSLTIAAFVLRGSEDPIEMAKALVRLALAWAAGLTVGYGTGWILLGQSLSNMAEYLAAAFDMANGYASVMGVAQTGAGWGPATGLALCLALGILATIVFVTHAGRRGLWSLVPVAAFLFFSFKLGYVRADWPHVMPFAAGVAVAAVAFAGRRATAPLAGIVIVAALAIGWTAMPAEVTVGRAVLSSANIGDGLDRLNLIVDGNDRSETVARFDAITERRISLRPSFEMLTAGRRVHIDPVETSQLWSVDGLEWGAAPVFQPYLAYSTALDQRNADWLVDPQRAPEFIIRTPVAVDFRERAGESPQFLFEMACRYGELRMQDQGWPVNGPTYLLERTQNRCGPIEFVSTVDADFGDEVDVPSCAGLTLYRVLGLESLGSRLQTTLYRDGWYFVDFGYGPERFVPLSSSAWHLVPDQAVPRFITEAYPVQSITLSADRLWFDPREVTIEFGCAGIQEL